MKIGCVGGGPAGLYFAISMKLHNPDHVIDVYERNRPHDTFGWGVVFSDQTVENLMANDPVSGATIRDEFTHWDDIDVHIHGECIRSSGHGFIGIGRKRLLAILQQRARDLGIGLHFEHEASTDPADWAEFDLVIAADGANSRIRTAHVEHFDVDIQVKKNKFFWFGTAKQFDAFTFAFEKTEAGWVWAHAYRFDDQLSTFIVEMAPETWTGLGLDTMDQPEAIALCEKLFAKHLDGNALMSNATHLPGPQAWLNFRRIITGQWSYDKFVLLGDAAHTAHFSIGSGTKLALEDAIKLAEVLNRPGLSRADALAEYQAERSIEVLKLQNSARNSTEWFETLDRYLPFAPIQFTYSLLTRSQRVSHENLRLRDQAWLEGVERWFQAQAPGGRDTGAPPMFAPFRLRELELANRIVVSPMAMYSATDGTPGDFHFVHYGTRAQGGAGLVYTEMTCVSPEGRITPGCPGMYTPEHVAGWKRITDFVHHNSKAKMCLQLGHSGAKGSTKLGWEGMDEPLDSGNWPLIAASDVPWSDANQTPRPMTRADMDMVRDQFVAATRMAIDAGFDMVEMHAAHGYLLSSFITPMQNHRTDDYGGSLENRLRFPLEVFTAMRAAWPSHKPMSVRISATDWMGDQGVTPEEAVRIAQAFHEAGADLIDVSAGQTWADCQPVYGRMFQTPFADQVRNEARVSTMAVGNIYETDHVNSILAAGRADLVALGRPHMIDPMWTLRAAAQHGYRGVAVPPAYLSGMGQLARNMQRAAEQEAALRG
ncbi:bifunctional salicylyl-CoA 5-hydroxylase/oxidoreductase [Blastomonas fulva]|uniref:bifunctional salicylyl-CoA 5-hydroxylase/oxidoreductase n=1 Tax=Blastomonas fulva TaxID=1550728 RepID=UPI0025A37E15|nr:bifunctional salicylyl-CoA 5-hydroxylase/oxidoreductase [Blastomonas fulva]MDM7929756.1 bifunctional salicylyl-CoA 5-hydroxylase/oxidoreductase [Blastomonas fulva]MDM7965622.1 bifunctional salicylyl-CoA 5-hydroxylase/oxidoreductase [Blastomonas fulva]